MKREPWESVVLPMTAVLLQFKVHLHGGAVFTSISLVKTIGSAKSSRLS